MDKKEREAAIRYVTHASASKEAEFIYVKLEDQVQAGHVDISLLGAATSLQNLGLLPVAVISHVGKRTHHFFTLHGAG